MGEIFLKVLNRSITAGWIILAVLCIRLLFRKSPKWINCLLWGVAAFRLACPFSIESRFSMLPGTEPVKVSTVMEGEVQNYIPSIDSRMTIVQNTINPMLAESFAYPESDSAAPWQVMLQVSGFVWACGMILLTICAAAGVVRLYMLVREAVCVRDNIYICDAVKSPFVFGIVRPRMYLPSALGEGEIRYIIAHESAHLKRKDHWWKALGYFLLCVYWFNPLCWAAYSLLCKDMELACDEKAAKDMSFQERKEYSKVLLSCASQRKLIMVCPLAFGEVGIKERVKSVLNYKKPALWIVITAAATCVILAVCFLTSPAKEYQIRITIPAGSTETFCYSDEEISPKGNSITLYAGEGLGDTEIILLPVEVREENAYDEAVYITPGMPVRMEVEKGAWFKIGVNIQNPTEESKDVYVSVSNVEVRIASSGEAGDSGTLTGQAPAEEAAEGQEGSAEQEGPTRQEAFAQQEGSAEQGGSARQEVPAQEIMLHEQPESDKVCIKVQPSMLRESLSYYYIPTGKDQEWLSGKVQALDLEGEPWERRWEGHKEKGWQIVYNDVELRAFEGGYLYYTYDGENGIMECFIEAPKLCDYIQIMLIQEIGYQTYDVSDIKDVVSARLDVSSTFTGGQFYSQTVTDAETLRIFEDWFRNAEYMPGGTACGNQYACLELTLADGNVVRLSMAADDCPNFTIDGVAYDYRPVSDWNNSEFYKCFDEIPWGLTHVK